MKFETVFKALTSYKPLRWQKRLYDQIRSGKLPDVCDLPTGLGKTSVIPIWLIAFAAGIEAGQSSKLPRRLIYIVNRRTVVDQATTIAEKLRECLDTQNGQADNLALEWLKTNLGKVRAVSSGPVLGISTLRGELADNEEWKSDPARPAIIVGTIDMIGSKLLFTGYGDNYKLRPHHAGLVGQDALIIHDEAHLTPAFSDLLQAVAKEQRQCREAKPIAVLELSATVSDTANREVFGLNPEDEQDDLVHQRLNAQKSLRLHESELADLPETITQLAFEHEAKASKVLIYVRSPETAKKVIAALKKRVGTRADERIGLLTGTIRGYERDRMLKEPIYKALLDSESSVEKTIYLVSTSAGEVGIDLDADHMVCDLTTLDAMIQRLGRVNRRGGKGRTAQVDVVVDTSKKKKKTEGEDDSLSPFEQARLNTHSALKQLPEQGDGGYSAGPITLRKLLVEAKEAVAPKPATAPLTDILLDGWALTTLKDKLPGQPEVAAYLHGLEDAQPETYVAWRIEIPLLAKAELSSEQLKDWFKHCRIEARERLHDATHRVLKELQVIADRHDDGVLPVVVLTERGEPEICQLRDVLNRSALAYRTIVLPTEVGGLSEEGLLAGKDDKAVSDVAEAGERPTRLRIMLRRVDNTYRQQPLIGNAMPDNSELSQTSPQKAAAQIARQHHWSMSQLVPLVSLPEGEEDEAEQRFLLLLVEPKRAMAETPESANAIKTKQPTVEEHCQLAEQWAARFATALELDDLQKQALTIAALWHDRGKDRKVWQRSIFNESEIPYAKSGAQGMDGHKLNGYRHEFGSLLEAMADAQINSHPEADLILHLIAVHHGWARPHFLPTAWDNERYKEAENIQAVLETMRRFGRLQQRFGRWGLAWLECLMRCTDIFASQQIALDNASTGEEASL